MAFQGQSYREVKTLIRSPGTDEILKEAFDTNLLLKEAEKEGEIYDEARLGQLCELCLG